MYSSTNVRWCCYIIIYIGSKNCMHQFAFYVLQWISISIRVCSLPMNLPVSESLTFCTANSPGSLSNKKYARLENTVSSDHRLAAFGSRSRRSTLKNREKNSGKMVRNEIALDTQKNHDVVCERVKKMQLKFIAQRIFLINSLFENFKCEKSMRCRKKNGRREEKKNLQFFMFNTEESKQSKICVEWRKRWDCSFMDSLRFWLKSTALLLSWPIPFRKNEKLKLMIPIINGVQWTWQQIINYNMS